MRTVPKGKRAGELVVSSRWRWRHLARFILVGLYTGSRAAAITGASVKKTEGRGWVDLESGLFHRRAVGAAETNKRQPPVSLPPHVLSHIERWTKDRGDKTISKVAIVEHRGKPVEDVNKAFALAVEAAGLGKDVTPHTLRHTAATWLMLSGCDIWSAAGYLGMSPEVLTRVYGHHHPDHQSEAKAAITRKPKSRTAPVRGTGGGQVPPEQSEISRDEPTSDAA